MTAPVVGVVLAGGSARRMSGAEKASLDLDGQSLLERVVSRIAPQVSALLLNANGDPSRFDDIGLPVEADSCADGLGPLAGLLTGMDWARRMYPACEWLLSVPVDTPFLPVDLAKRLSDAREMESAEVALAVSGERLHPVVGLWPVAHADELRHALESENLRKVDRWTGRFRVAEVAYDCIPVDPFFNINTPSDLEAAEAFLGS